MKVQIKIMWYHVQRHHHLRIQHMLSFFVLEIIISKLQTYLRFYQKSWRNLLSFLEEILVRSNCHIGFWITLSRVYSGLYLKVKIILDPLDPGYLVRVIVFGFHQISFVLVRLIEKQKFRTYKLNLVYSRFRRFFLTATTR